ncbi:NAD(P)-dependent alcohol dehydrogenase [Seongchinamella sediminis]|nr:NAD(P)-dependent alcohol dehydrogenase [Seongchinamella sediminis]
MKILFRTIVALLLIATAGGIFAAYQLSRTSPCPADQSSALLVAPEGKTMMAVRQHCYGPPSSLVYAPVPRPAPGPGELLVRVHAAGVNPLDWHTMRGSPYLMRLGSGFGAPDESRFGVDFSGVVSEVGSGVTRFKVGDRVFGGATGAFAEFLLVRENQAISLVPEGISHQQAAAVAIAGLTALQALRDKGQLQAGQKVLINGASGGVGSFAVQLARHLGAEVYGVSSTRNVRRVLALGAQRVFDYTRESYLDSDELFDLIVDMVGNHSPLANTAALTPGGRLVIVGGPSGDWLGPVTGPLLAMLSKPFVDQEMVILLAQLNSADLDTMAELMDTGAVTPLLDSRYPLAEYAAALTHSETGRARGKIILDIHP